MRSNLYILEGKMPVLVTDTLEWGKWYETADRQVARDSFVIKNGEIVTISTVFLGLDHGWCWDPRQDYQPVLFETMIFGGPHDQSQWRYHTWEEAETGHNAIVEKIQADATEISEDS